MYLKQYFVCSEFKRGNFKSHLTLFFGKKFMHLVLILGLITCHYESFATLTEHCNVIMFLSVCVSDATFYSDALILPLAAFIEKLQYVKVGRSCYIYQNYLFY